jgi:regulatory protein
MERRARRAAVTDPDVVMDAAAAFLSVRPRSVAETRRRLRELGYPTTLCDGVVDRLVGLGYLDDRAFARTWLESRDRTRPRGRLALAQELQRKGVPRDVVDEALSERQGSALDVSHPGAPGESRVELEAALRLLERRASALERETDVRRRRVKAFALLARHGFAPDVCRDATVAFMSVTPEAPEDDV